MMARNYLLVAVLFTMVSTFLNLLTFIHNGSTGLTVFSIALLCGEAVLVFFIGKNWNKLGR